MARLARILRSRGFRAAVILPMVVITFVVVTIDTARACWITILQECFDRPIPQWPWDPAGEGRWRPCAVVGNTTYCWPSIPNSVARWGVHSGNYYDVIFCEEDDRSLWCYGYPVSNDPEFDNYPASYDTYVLFGPFSLATAAAAHVVFRMYNESEPVHDSLFWGASTTYPLTNALMKIAGTESFDTPNGWETREMDLADLYDFTTGDSVSMLGQASVYVWWRFRSDANAERDVGSFIDNVIIAYDDGTVDIATHPSEPCIELLDPDSNLITSVLELGDTLRARFGWTICNGGVEVYDSFRVMLTDDDVVRFDTLIVGDTSGTTVNLYSPLWIVESWGEFIVRLKVDTLNSISESNENNNADTSSYTVLPPNPPPEFYWINPGTDTLWADRLDTTVTLRWFLRDVDEPSWITIRYGNSPVNCTGTVVPGIQDHQSIDAQDSVVWDIRSLFNNRTYWLWAEMYDSENNACVRALGPMRTCDGCLTDVSDHPPGFVPDAYFLEQNYPNPFNPLTEIRYGVAKAGHVTLRVFDVLGREQVALVNKEQTPGTYAVPFNGSALSSGIYMYVLTTPEGTIARKMMLLK